MTGRLYLFATIGGTPVAVEAADVEAVVRLREIVPVSRVPQHIVGLAALRSRVLTVIDMHCRISGLRSQDMAMPIAIVAQCGGHGYGLLVDDVEDICLTEAPVQPVRGRMDRNWRGYVHGVIEHQGRAHLILHLTDFVGATQQAA